MSIAERVVALLCEHGSQHPTLLQHLSTSAVLLTQNGSPSLPNQSYTSLADACNTLLTSNKVFRRCSMTTHKHCRRWLDHTLVHTTDTARMCTAASHTAGMPTGMCGTALCDMDCIIDNIGTTTR